MLSAVLSKFCGAHRGPSNTSQKRKALSYISPKTIGNNDFDMAVLPHMVLRES